MPTHDLAQTEYPDNCLRGIKSPTQILEDGLVATEVFLFQDRDTRPDGTFEMSINWEDDEKVIPFTLAQVRSDGDPLFRGGLAVISRSELDRLSHLPVFGDLLSYDREGLPDNPHHGNLTLEKGVSKQRRNVIAANLAGHVCHVVRR